MINTLRLWIRANPRIRRIIHLIYRYQLVLKVHELIIGVFAIRIDAHTLRETFLTWSGGQGLSRHDLRAFENFFSKKISNQEENFLIIDVGGHEGWFIQLIYRFCKTSNYQIYCIEPLPSKLNKLRKLLKRSRDHKLISKALGANVGTAVIREYGSTGLSSFLALAEEYQYQDSSFNTRLVREVEVDVTTLDELLVQELDRTVVLKIDTQGFEYQILSGARNSLKSRHIKYIIVEVMTVEKYKDGPTYEVIFELLHSFGYRLYDINCTYYEKNTGQMTEFDAFFEANPLHQFAPCVGSMTSRGGK